MTEESQISSKEKEMKILKDKVNEVVYEIKNNRDYAAASVLFNKYNLSFEVLIRSTARLSIEDLVALADKVISQE